MLGRFIATAAIAVCSVSSLVAAVPTISAVGSKFFYSNGTQFYIKGIAYQRTEDDPLLNNTQCELDASTMADLGANAIRVYHVNPKKDHTDCMKTFANEGIYLFVDLDTFDTQIEQNAPHWNQSQYNAFKAVLDEFQQYSNTAGVFVGNEVLTTANGSIAAPYVKAAARDIKAYRDSKSYREIPVGYSAADIADLRPMLQNYMACSDNSSENLDFFSLNAYEWCGSDSSYTISGYSELEKNATGYSIPIFFSETGCNTVRPRTFDDQAAIFGSNMDDTWSGAIIYEWIEETNDYGLVSYGPEVDASTAGTNAPDGFTRSGTPTPISPDYYNLQSQWSTLSPTGVKLSDYTASTSTITHPDCPSSTSDGWAIDPSSSLPSLGQTYSATKTTGTSATNTGTSTAASATSTKKGGASGGKEIAGMSIGLVGVMLVFVAWL